MPTKAATSKKSVRPKNTSSAAKALTVKKLATRTIKQSVVIRATPVEVYDALVNAKKHAAFTGAKATSSNKEGGKFTAWDGYITGKYQKLAPGRKIVAQWSTREWPSEYPPSLIEFTFERADKGMRLTMVQSEVPAAQAPNYRQGWKDYYWTPLKKYFAAKV
ncbi:MAG TPA: SRPBCC family protein [Candidatus Binataceae bacterium]|nr:SRPBCC family protein [Candidatus Binataceae bacterium]